MNNDELYFTHVNLKILSLQTYRFINLQKIYILFEIFIYIFFVDIVN